MEVELPWTWRNNRRRTCAVPWGDTFKQCAECGQTHKVEGMLIREDLPPTAVAFANPMLGVIVCQECAKLHQEILRPEGLGKMIYLFYDLHEWSLDDIAQMARWGNGRAQRFWLHSFSPDVRTYQGIVPRPASILPREWIERKYIQREWMMQDTPIPVRRLLPYHVYEQRVFAHLHRMNWTPPAAAFSTASFSGTPTQGSPVSVSIPSPTSSRKPVPEKKPNEPNPPFINKLLSTEIPVTPTLFASQSFPKVSNEPAVPPPIHCLQTFPPLPAPLWKASTAKPLDWSTKTTTRNPVPPPPPQRHPPPLESPSSRAESWTKAVPRIPRSSPPRDGDLSWREVHYYDDDSEYSDDLYGSGRPLRPSLINPVDKIQEWQASSHGNPKVTQFLENTFTPDSPRLAETTPEKPTKQAVQTAVASFFQDEFHAALTSKRATTPPPNRNRGDRKPSKELEILIPVDEDIPGVATEIVAQGGGAVEEGNTIIEEDASILADLDSAFAMQQEQMEFLKMYGMDEGEVDFRCMSDGGTEVDSEFDKIEYEFQLVREEMSEDEMESEEGKEDEMKEEDDEVRCSAWENKTMAKAFGGAEDVEHGQARGDAIDFGILPQQTDSKGYNFDISPSEWSVETPHPSISSSPQTPSVQQSKSNAIPEHSFPLSETAEEPVPSSSFSNIIIDTNLSKSDGKVDRKDKKDGKEDLRDFLLRSGLFVAKR